MADSASEDLAPIVTAKPKGPTSGIPLATRNALEIPRPRYWQQFQQNCVYLYRYVLKDPNTHEYGRSGQKQRGLDILGRRNADAKHPVGIQCRRVVKPLKLPKILKDCRDALGREPGLKEIIFATTAPDDTGATDAAGAVEKLLRKEGYDITVIVNGWDALSLQIAEDDFVYNVFFPQPTANLGPVEATLSDDVAESLADQIAAKVVKQLERNSVAPRVVDQGNPDDGEDAALHARIDVYRDLTKIDKELVIAQKGLVDLKIDAKAQPRAEFRRITNLGAIALNLGKEEEGAELFEQAYALRPADPKALANLSLARLIQHKPDEALALAQQAFALEPDADMAAYVLQAAAKSSWQGDPETLIPDTAKGSLAADLALAEFTRVREIEGWQAKAIALANKHPEDATFRKVKALATVSLAADGFSFLSGAITGLTDADLNAAATELKAIVLQQLDLADKGYPDLWTAANNAALGLRLAGRLLEAEDLLNRTVAVRPDAPKLRFLLGLILALQGKKADAVETLRQCPEDGEATGACGYQCAIGRPRSR